MDGDVRGRSGGVAKSERSCGSDLLYAQHQNKLKPVSKRNCQTKMDSSSVNSGGPVVSGLEPVVPGRSCSSRTARDRPNFLPIRDFFAKSREIG